MTPKPSETGAALLAVLLLVAVMAALAAVALEKMTLSARAAANAAALEQARAFALGAESYALLRIGDLKRLSPDRTTLAGGWHGVPIRIPLPAGFASATVTDGGNCFNLNSVVRRADTPPGTSGTAPPDPANPAAPVNAPADIDPVLVPDSRGIRQLVALLQVVGTPTGEAQTVADGLADWVDTDSTPGPAGAEDSAYAGLPVPYRTPNRLVVDASELRAVAGVTPEIFAAIAPWLCALPVPTLSPINVNTLSETQAPLLAMLLPGQLGLEDARALIARRPATGFRNVGDFWAQAAVAGLGGEAQRQTVTNTRWFRLALDVELDGAQMSETALIDGGSRPAKLVSRVWGQD